MSIVKKFGQLITNNRDEKEVERWLFSLTPLGVAFVFFFIFLLPMELPEKNMFLVLGAAAGFSGLQGYWIFRGWQRNEGSTVILGMIGLAITVGLVYLYLTFIH